MERNKVFIVGGGYGFTALFQTNGWDISHSMQEAGLVQFTGGEDIHPAIYGHTLHSAYYGNIERDRREIEAFKLAVTLGKPIAGVCRGGQLINCLMGGTMWQDVDNHAGKHHEVVDDITGEIWITNSIHHQMMSPTKDVTWLAHSIDISTYREKSINNKTIVVNSNPFREPEVLYYEAANALCFQGHPEMGGHDLQKRYFKYINKHCMKVN